MKTQDLYNDFLAYCQKNADDALVKKYARYFRDNHDAWGLSQPLMDAKANEIFTRPDFDLDLVFEAAPLFLKSGKYEETSLILVLLNKGNKKFRTETFQAIEGLFSQGIRNWAHADMLGMTILPEFLLKKLVKASDFIPWISSPYKFQRRCVPVTFIKPLKKGAGLSEYLEIAEKLMKDEEREVHQGVGWFLREAWKLHPAPVEAFLSKYKETAPRLIFQYACEKMNLEDKARFKRAK